MEIKDYLDKFEEKLKDELIYLCTSYEMLNGNLLETIDVEQRWTDFAPEYVADAIKEIKDYPTVSVAWAAFIGAAVAYYWDKDTTMFGACKYKSFYGPNGFDDMDEYILYKILLKELSYPHLFHRKEQVIDCRFCLHIRLIL